MNLPGITFLVYVLPVLLLLFYMLSFSKKVQEVFLLAANLFLYSWGKPVYVLLLLFSITVNYMMGIMIRRLRSERKNAKTILRAAWIINISLLFTFQHMGYLIYKLLSIVERQGAFIPLMMPVGFGYVTLRALSYVTDVYRGDAEAEISPLNLALYLSFYPQLIAGPIVAYQDMVQQIRNRKITLSGFSRGMGRLATGTAKVILIGHTMAAMADHIFNLSAMSNTTTNVPVTMAWLGVIAYAFQLYYIWSGCVDMAIGLSWIAGLAPGENYNYPYVSKSVTEFWERWNLSLLAWFKKYLYSPLGDRRMKNNDLMVKNMFIIWLLIGAWHGSEWTFLLWGVWHFIFITIERVIEFNERKISNVVRHFYTLFVVLTGWTLFRALDIYQAFLYIRNLFGLNENGFFSDTAMMMVRENRVYLLLAILFSAPLGRMLGERLDDGRLGKTGTVFAVIYPFGIVLVFLVSITCLAV